jgi:hypothetical protein
MSSRWQGRAGAIPVSAVGSLGGALIAVHVLLTAWRLKSAWWWQDDLILLSRASDRSLLDLLLSNYNGHLVPGTWVVAWLADVTSTYNWGWAIGSTCALVLLVDAALLALLVRLFGDRLAVQVPLVMWISAGSMMTPTMWWAAAMQWLPVTGSLLLALYHHIEYWRTQRTRSAVGAVLAVVFGLAFFEKAALIVGVLFLFTLLYGVDGSLLTRFRAILGRAPDYWGAHLVLVVAYAAVYLPTAHGASKASYAVSDLAGLAHQFTLNHLLPSVFGGPLEWFGPYSTLPTAPTWFRIMSWTLTVGILFGSLLRRRGAWKAWLLLLVFTVITLALLAATRLGFYGEVIGLDGRYSSDVVAVTVVCFTLAWIPTQERSGDERVIVIPATTATQYRCRSRRRLATQAVVAVGVVTVLIAGIVSATRYAANWTPSPTRAYMETLQQELRTHPEIPLFDQLAPDQILQPAFGDDRRLSVILRPSGLRPRLQSWQTDLHLVDDAGHIRPGQLTAAPVSATTQPRCTNNAAPLRITLDDTPRPLSIWTMKFAYAVSKATTVTVTLGLGNVQVPLQQGVHTVFVQSAGNGDTITFAAPPDSGFCISTLSIGTATPVQ